MRTTGGRLGRKSRSKSGHVDSQDFTFSLKDLDVTKIMLQHDDDRLTTLRALLARQKHMRPIRDSSIVGALVASQMSPELALERLKRLHAFYAEEAGSSMSLASDKFVTGRLILMAPLQLGPVVYFIPPDMLSATGLSTLFLGAFEYVDVTWGAITLVLHLASWTEEDTQGAAGISLSLRLLPLHISKIIFVDAPDHVIAQNYETSERRVIYCTSHSQKLFNLIPEKDLLADMGGFKAMNDFPTYFQATSFFNEAPAKAPEMPRGTAGSPRLDEDSDTVELDDSEPEETEAKAQQATQVDAPRETKSHRGAPVTEERASPGGAGVTGGGGLVLQLPRKNSITQLFDELSSSEDGPELSARLRCDTCNRKICQCSRIDKPSPSPARRRRRRKKKSSPAAKAKAK